MLYATEVTDMLGGTEAIGSPPSTDNDFIDLVREGLPYQSVVAASQFLDLKEELALACLRISTRTAARRKAKDERLREVESERLLRLARLAATAIDVLGDRGKAVRWLQRPNRGLGGRVPLQLLDTDIGFQSAIDELQRVEFGVFS